MVPEVTKWLVVNSLGIKTNLITGRSLSNAMSLSYNIVILSSSTKFIFSMIFSFLLASCSA